MYKTLNPKWNQTLEFPDDGSPLELHVKDYNALLPTSNIGDCVVEYQGLPVNQMADRWIPLQGVKRGEIHVQITKRVPEMQKKSSLGGESPSSKSHQISSQVRMSIRSISVYIKLSPVVNTLVLSKPLKDRTRTNISAKCVCLHVYQLEMHAEFFIHLIHLGKNMCIIN